MLQSLTAQAEAVRKVWDEAFAALKKDEFATASRTADHGVAAAAWRGSFPTLLAGLPPEAVAPLTLVADSLDRVRGYAVDLAEVAMNHPFQRQAAKL